jgi:hypothetical protein
VHTGEFSPANIQDAFQDKRDFSRPKPRFRHARRWVGGHRRSLIAEQRDEVFGEVALERDVFNYLAPDLDKQCKTETTQCSDKKNEGHQKCNMLYYKPGEDWSYHHRYLWQDGNPIVEPVRLMCRGGRTFGFHRSKCQTTPGGSFAQTWCPDKSYPHWEDRMPEWHLDPRPSKYGFIDKHHMTMTAGFREDGRWRIFDVTAQIHDGFFGDNFSARGATKECMRPS